MNKIISILRMAILLALGIFAILLIFSEEQEADLSTWILRVIIDKASGIGAFFLMSWLYRRWRKTDAWIMAYDMVCNDKVCNNVMDAPDSSAKS